MAKRRPVAKYSPDPDKERDLVRDDPSAFIDDDENDDEDELGDETEDENDKGEDEDLDLGDEETEDDEEDGDEGKLDKVAAPTKPRATSATATPNSIPKLTPEQLHQVAKQAKQAVKIPEPPKYSLRWEEFIKWYSPLTSAMKDSISLYLYRINPYVDNRMHNPKAPLHISVLDRPDMDDIIANHGGGRYKIIVNDVSGKSGKKLCEVQIKIPMTEHEPKIDLSTLVIDEPRNKGYINMLISQGKMTSDGMPIITGTRQMQGNNSGDSTAQTILQMNAALIERLLDRVDADQIRSRDKSGEDHAVTKAIDMMAAAGEKNLEFVMSQARDSSPEKSMALINGIVASLGALMPKQDNSNIELLKYVTTLQQQNTQMLIEVLKSNRETNPASGDDGISSFEKMIGAMTAARDFFGTGSGGGGSARKSTLETVLEHVAPAIGPTLNLITNIIAASAMKRGGMPTPSQPNPGAGTVGMTRTQLLQRQAQEQRAAAAGTSVPINQHIMQNDGIGATEPETVEATMGNITGTEQQNPQLQAVIDVLQRYGGYFQLALSQGKSGDIFAEDVINLAGRPVYKQIANIGADLLLQGLRAMQADYQQLVGTYGEAEIVKFVQDFCNAEELIRQRELEDDLGDELEEEDEPEIITPQVVATSGGKRGKRNG